MGSWSAAADTTFVSSGATAERVTRFLRAVYGWMFVGLAITATVALWVARSGWLAHEIASRPGLYLGLVVVQLGVVVALSAMAARLEPAIAALLFLGYSALTGLTVSYVLLLYTGQSIATTFIVTAGTFAAMAIYGSTTSRSLAGWGQFLFMGLIGVVLAGLVGLFWHNDQLQFLVSFAGVIVFTGLTAWDAQRLKRLALAVPEGREGSYAVAGALSLYLNFINLFLSLLRFMGRRN
jgi:hypothetical protein